MSYIYKQPHLDTIAGVYNILRLRLSGLHIRYRFQLVVVLDRRKYGGILFLQIKYDKKERHTCKVNSANSIAFDIADSSVDKISI